MYVLPDVFDTNGFYRSTVQTQVVFAKSSTIEICWGLNTHLYFSISNKLKRSPHAPYIYLFQTLITLFLNAGSVFKIETKTNI